MNFILNIICNIQHKSDKVPMFREVQRTDGGFDLMIVDIPKGLHVPTVFYPPTSILD